MPDVLHLYNLLGALPERVWLEYPSLLADRFPPTLGYETRAAECPAIDVATVQLARVSVGPTDDVDGQMDAVAADPGHPARGLLGREFALVHGHTGPRVLLAAPFLARGIPGVFSLYGYDASRLLVSDPMWGARYRWAAGRGAVFVTLCESMAAKLRAVGVPDSALRIIPLGLRMERWSYAPRPAPAEPRFVFVGRLAPKKGADDLLRAMARLPSKHAACLDVVGSGPLEGILKAIAGELGIAGRVTFHGAVARERIAAILDGATALVLSSKTAPDGDAEGTPIVLMEAQAVGVPVVTTRHMGNPDVLPPDSPFLTPEGNVVGLAESMARIAALSATERRALQDAGRGWIEANFDLNTTAARYAALYEELIAKRG